MGLRHEKNFASRYFSALAQ